MQGWSQAGHLPGFEDGCSRGLPRADPQYGHFDFSGIQEEVAPRQPFIHFLSSVQEGRFADILVGAYCENLILGSAYRFPLLMQQLFFWSDELRRQRSSALR